MNLLDYKVKEVIGEPEHNHHKNVEWWSIKVVYDDYHEKDKVTQLTFQTPQECNAVTVGTIFQR